MDKIFESIEEWMRNLLTGMVSSNLTNMFTDVNEKTGDIASQVGQTPQGWNGSIFSLIQNLSDSVIVPIAGMIITFVLCYELISMLTEKNNMHDIDTWMFFKYFFKMWVAVWFVSNAFTITMAIFDVGQNVVNRASGVINHQTAINIDSVVTSMETAMESMEVGELVILALETLLASLCLKVISVFITVILYGRMIEIYCASRNAAFHPKAGVRAFWDPGFSKPVKKSIKDVKSVTLASSDLLRRETTRGTIAYRKNRKLGKPSTHD